MGYSFWYFLRGGRQFPGIGSFEQCKLWVEHIEREGGCKQEVHKVLDGRYELIHEYTKQGGVGKNLKN